MTTTGRRWGLGAAVGALVLAFAGLVGGPGPPATAGDAPKTATWDAARAVTAVVKTLATTKTGPIPGTPATTARPMLTGWSQVVTDWMTPLETSPWAVPGARGLVRLYLSDKIADDLAVHLVVPGVDRAALLAALKASLVEHGFEVTDDEANPWSCWGQHPGGRHLWCGVGEGLVSVELNIGDPAEHR